MQKLNESLLEGGKKVPPVCYKHSFVYIRFLPTTQVLESDSISYEPHFLDLQGQGQCFI